MLNVLFIALEFPPIQAAGAFRALRFAKLLPDHGIRPIVVSFNPAQFLDSQVHQVSPAFAKEIPAETPLYLLDVSAIEPDKTPLAPGVGRFRGTHCATFDDLFQRVGADFDIDMIWVTCPPFNVGPLAIAAKRHFKRPLLLDMRDAWSQWGSSPFRTWLHYRRVLTKEQTMLNAADSVVCVTPQLLDMEWALTRKPRDVFHWIPNAYEQENLPSGLLELTAGKGRLRVGYSGQFYYNSLYEDVSGVIPWYRKKPHRWLHYYSTRQRWLYRTPYFFFRAWRALRSDLPSLGDSIEFHYVGDVPSWLPLMAREHGIEDLCTWHGFKPKQEAQNIMNDCDAFLSTSIKVDGGEDYCLASKTFDYIAARKPVLGFVSPGTQYDFLKGSNIAVILDPDDTDAAAYGLAEVLREGVRREINSSYLSNYSSLETTRQLADLIKSIAR